MSVSLAEIVAAARCGAASFVAESAGYIVLALADGALRSFRTSSAAIDGWMARLDAQGDLIAGGAGRIDSEDAAERALRRLLGELLEAVRTPSPNLLRVAERGTLTGFAHLVVELEAALVPVNRKAARRSLARLCRETQRALERGVQAAPLMHGSSLLQETAIGSPPAARPSPKILSALAPDGDAARETSGATDAVDELSIDVVFEEPGAPSVSAEAPVQLDFTALLSPVPEPAAASRGPRPASQSQAPQEPKPQERALAPAPREVPFVAETPAPILAAAARPERTVASRSSVEPLELTRATPAVAPRHAASFEVPPLEVAPLPAEGEEVEREETPTRVWAPVVLDQAPRAEEEGVESVWDDAEPWAEDASLPEETRVDWTVAEQTEVTAPYEPFEEDLEEPTSDAGPPAEPATPRAGDHHPVAADSREPSEPPVEESPAEPPTLRLSRRRPSDVAELLARHGWARKTDETELFEGLGRLAELERSLG